MKFVETIKNIFKIEELRKRLVYTFILILVYRLGCFVVLPGIDASLLAGLQSKTQDGLVGLLNMFSGGAFGNASIFALGVMPYISASIVIQLLGVFVPYFRKLQMEGESGRKKMNQMTRWLTIVIICIQGPAYMAAVHSQIPAAAFVAVNQLGWSNFMFNIVSTIILMAGSMFVMWLGERITDRGIGNGISLIIMIGIVARLPYALAAEIGEKVTTTNGGVLLLIVELLVLFFVFVAAIALVQAVRRIPIQYAKRVIGNKQYGGVRNYLPLKINAAGVMPIIFASALVSIPGTIRSFFNVQSELLIKILNVFNYNGFVYAITYLLLIIAFNYFYVTMQYNPVEIANNLRKNNGVIPGFRPGKMTQDFIQKVLGKITFIGAIFLGVVAILPIVTGNLTGTGIQMGGTSLLIIVGVALETAQMLENEMVMRHHKGFLE